MFITLAGRKRVGKSTAAEILKDLLENQGKTVKITNFAEALKKAINIIFDISLEDMETEEGKNKLTHIPWPTQSSIRGSWHSWSLYENSIVKPAYMTVRELLQYSGTDLFRNQLYEPVWVDSVFNKKELLAYDYVLVGDARFENEVIAAKKHGVVVRILRNTGLTDSHSSETSLDKLDLKTFDFILDNNSTLEELKQNLQNIIKN